MNEEHWNSDFRRSAPYQAALAFLFDRINFEHATKMPYSKRDLNIRRMRRLLELLDDPHEKLSIVHIAGTKGKGSTAAFVSSAVVASGRRCGCYTSPHLQYVEERFQIDGEPCSPETLASLIEQVRPAVETMDEQYEGGGPTYFEICTALAFVLFLDRSVDIAVLEVGLGGRLDSTNVCTPIVSVITTISFDHVKQLGNTLRQIATEKAGIIKHRVPIVSGVVRPEARLAIEAIARRREAPLFEIGKDFGYENYVGPSKGQPAHVDFYTGGSDPTERLDQVRLGLIGEHQAANASVAWSALKKLPDSLRPHDGAIRNGFAAVQCDARIEVVSQSPTVIVDSSHNVASVQALVDVLESVYCHQRRILVLGATIGKDVEGMLKILLPSFEQVICTQYQNNPRAYPATSLQALAEKLVGSADNATSPVIRCEALPSNAWRFATEYCPQDGLICVTGSFFIAAEVKAIMRS